MSPEAAIQQISTALGASWASGINLYATILTMGILHSTGVIVLPTGLEFLANPMVLGAAGVMFCVEFFVDKIPGVDSAWDSLHTFIRIPAGVVMAYGAVEGMGPVVEFSSALIGGTLATATHVTKAGTRVMINTSPEPVTNWTASFIEDFAVIGGLWVALTHPWLFLCLLGLFILFMIWLLPKVWHGIRKVFGFLFREAPPEPESESGAG
jgi:hypothetical protein